MQVVAARDKKTNLIHFHYEAADGRNAVQFELPMKIITSVPSTSPKFPEIPQKPNVTIAIMG